MLKESSTIEQEQRSIEWFEAKAGKFSSSRAYELMGVKGLGLTGEGYAFEMAIEIAEGRNEEEGFLSFDMQRGVELEPYAFNKFSELMAINFIDVEKCGFIELGENMGSSPDGLVGDNGVLEIKCPKPETFFKLVRTGEIDKKYYDQMQHQMWITGRSIAYFFNYIIYNGVEKWHLIEVPRDEERINLMKERTKIAIALRDAFVSELKENAQYNLY